jgi:asparagine synthase (glutamine-hydrolysing)
MEGKFDNAFALWPILTLGIWKAGLAAANNDRSSV